MLTLEVRRRPGAGAEMHRISGPSATVGASSGNEIVVRARGVYGRHLRLFERDGSYHVDLFKGIEAVNVNGRAFFGGAIAPGDRIAIGEATITVVEAPQPSGATTVPIAAGDETTSEEDSPASEWIGDLSDNIQTTAQAVIHFPVLWHWVEQTANDPSLYLDMEFLPGDIQLLKNSVILHKRTTYEDWEDPARKRHLLRLWLSAPDLDDGDEQLRGGIRLGRSS